MEYTLCVVVAAVVEAAESYTIKIDLGVHGRLFNTSR